MLYEDRYLMTSSIVAENRKGRPTIDEEEKTCPFCLGHEKSIEYIKMDVKAWKEHFLVRIVNNKFPVCGKGMSLKGEHDVVIDTPLHLQHPKDFSKTHWYVLLQTIQKRWHQLSECSKIKFIQVFKNYGVDAGASIRHSHWQIIALEQIPSQVKLKYQYFNRYKEAYHQCYLCSIIEKFQDQQVIVENEHWVAVAPQVSEFAHETWLIPRIHRKHYGCLSINELHSCSMIMKKLLIAYDQLKKNCAFNICFMGGDTQDKQDFHFYIKIIPRLSHVAGFELATGCYINTVHPYTHVQLMKKLLNE